MFGASKMHLTSPPIVCVGPVLVFVLVCITLGPFQFCNYLDQRAGCCACIVFWMSCYCKCPVAFLMVPCVCLQFVLVVSPDHSHLLFYYLVQCLAWYPRKHPLLISDAVQTLNGPRREKTCLRRFANNKGADQPAHPRSLISAFVIRVLERTISKLAIGGVLIF